MKRGARFCLNKCKFEPIAIDMADTLLWVDVQSMYKIEILKVAHQIRYGYAPPYLSYFVNLSNVNVKIKIH